MSESQTICPGRLVLHRQGEVAFCTEEIEGRVCLGYDTPHFSPPDNCWLVIAGTPCAICDRVGR
jgi:hypothetical protein